MPAIFWEVILALIAELLQNCPEERAIRALRTPMERERRLFRLRLFIRLTNPFTGIMSIDQWRSEGNDIMNEVESRIHERASADPEELLEILGVTSKPVRTTPDQ